MELGYILSERVGQFMLSDWLSLCDSRPQLMKHNCCYHFHWIFYTTACLGNTDRSYRTSEIIAYKGPRVWLAYICQGWCLKSTIPEYSIWVTMIFIGHRDRLSTTTITLSSYITAFLSLSSTWESHISHICITWILEIFRLYTSCPPPI